MFGSARAFARGRSRRRRGTIARGTIAGDACGEASGAIVAHSRDLRRTFGRFIVDRELERFNNRYASSPSTLEVKNLSHRPRLCARAWRADLGGFSNPPARNRASTVVRSLFSSSYTPRSRSTNAGKLNPTLTARSTRRNAPDHRRASTNPRDSRPPPFRRQITFPRFITRRTPQRFQDGHAL